MSRTTITVKNATGTMLDFAIVHYSSDSATSEVGVCQCADNQQFILNNAGGDHSQALNIAYGVPQGGSQPGGIWDLQLDEKSIPISIVGRSVTLILMFEHGVPSVLFIAPGQVTKQISLHKCTKPQLSDGGGFYLSNTNCP